MDSTIYTIRFPLLMTSTALCNITGGDGEVVGHIHRYHATGTQRMINMLMSNWFNNVCASDREGETVVNIVEVNTPRTMLRERWDVRVRGRTFHLENRSKVRTHPRFVYSRNGGDIWITKEPLDRTVRFKLHGRIVAEATPDRPVPPASCRVTFRLTDPEPDIYEVAALYYVFRLKSV